MDNFPFITELPEAPIRNQPEEDYANTASIFVGALAQFRDELNDSGAYIQGAITDAAQHLDTSTQLWNDTRIITEQLQDDIHTFADQTIVTITNEKNQAEQHKNAAAHSANRSEASAAVSASNANFRGVWSELVGSVTVPASVYHNNTHWTLLRDVTNVAQSEPGASTDWAPLSQDGSASIIPPKEGHSGKGLFLSEDETHLVFGQTAEPYEVKVDDFTAEYGGVYHVDASLKQIKITLPSHFLKGGIVKFVDAKGNWADRPPTLLGAGVQVVNDSEMELDVSYIPVEMIRTSNGWVFG